MYLILYTAFRLSLCVLYLFSFAATFLYPRFFTSSPFIFFETELFYPFFYFLSYVYFFFNPFFCCCCPCSPHFLHFLFCSHILVSHIFQPYPFHYILKSIFSTSFLGHPYSHIPYLLYLSPPTIFLSLSLAI